MKEKNKKSHCSDKGVKTSSVFRTSDNCVQNREIVTLAVTLGKVAKCLLMCAPQFPAGSEGAVAVELARKSIPAVREILRPREIKNKSGA